MTSGKFNRGTPWGVHKSFQSGPQSNPNSVLPLKPIPYIHTQSLWFGNISEERLARGEVKTILVIGNYGGLDWETRLLPETFYAEPIITHGIVIPSLYILRLPVQLNLGKMRRELSPQTYYHWPKAIRVEGMSDQFVGVRLLFKWNKS